MSSRRFFSACAIVALIVTVAVAGCSSQTTSAPAVPGPTATPTGAPVATP